VSTHPGWGRLAGMQRTHQSAVLNRLKTAGGHLAAVVRMVEDDTYCPEIMKQLSAVQGSLEGASRLVLRNHLETCVAAAMQDGRTEEIVDELMEALRYDRIAVGPGPELELATGEVAS
jgi:CsoR family transcriptional regulator, copper-sensing transcriptional repressor